MLYEVAKFHDHFKGRLVTGEEINFGQCAVSSKTTLKLSGCNIQ